MAVLAIDAVALRNLCNNCGAVGFTPAVAYAFDAGADTVTLTNTSTLPSGDTYGKMKAQVFDKFGKEVRGAQTVKATALVISTATLNKAEPLDIKVTMLTVGGIAADGGAYNIGAAGTIDYWDVKKY